MPMIQIDKSLCVRSEDVRTILGTSTIQSRIGLVTGEVFGTTSTVKEIFDLINQAERKEEDAFKS